MPARFKLDENLPRDAETLLRDAGHDVHTVLAEQLGGNPDPLVFDAAQREQRILVTLDLDFADIRAYPPGTHQGVWVIRPNAHGIRSVLALLQSALVLLNVEPAQGRLWIVEPDRVRIREQQA
jgi:predicted nuclease of predicted toxin-antitoxin system